MAYTETTRTTYGQNLKSKFGAIGTGFLLFIASFGLLWCSQGVTKYAKIAKKSVPIEAETVDTSMEGQFVSVTGNLNTTERIGDPQFIVPGDYISLHRNVEVYAWVEHSSSSTRENIGGSTETTTTYTYSQEWINPAFLENSDNFKEPQYPRNPSSVSVPETSFSVSTATVGAYDIDPQTMSLPYGGEKLVLNRNMLTRGGSGSRLEGDFIYQGSGEMSNPRIGDVRISYTYLENDVEVTVFAKLNGNRLVKYVDPNDGDIQMYRALRGDRETAINSLRTEDRIKIWLMMGGGFLMMWIGLQMILGFIPALLQVLPFLKNAGKFVIGLVTFVIALGLSLLTLLISAIAHNPIILIIVVVVLVGGIILIAMNRKNKKGGGEAPVSQ